MATSKLYDRVKVGVASAPSTGAVALGSAVSGYRSFAVVTDGATVSYVIEDGASWEMGQGTYAASGPTLTRTTIYDSSNAGAAIKADASAVVYLTLFAADIVAAAAAGNAPAGTLPVIVQKSENHVNGGAVSVTMPSAPTQGNLLVAITIGQDSYTANSGWTLVSAQDGQNGSGQQMRTGIAIKTAGAGESVTQSPTGGSYAQIYEVSGFNSSDATLPTLANVAMRAGSPISATISQAAKNSLILGAVFVDDNGSVPSISTSVILDTQDTGIAGHYFGVQSFHYPTNAVADFVLNATKSTGQNLALTMVALLPKTS